MKVGFLGDLPRFEQEVEGTLGVPLGAGDGSERREDVRFALSEAGPSMAGQALLGERSSTSQVSSPQDRHVCKAVEEDRGAAFVPEPTSDLERLLPALLGQIGTTERELHPALHP